MKCIDEFSIPQETVQMERQKLHYQQLDELGPKSKPEIEVFGGDTQLLGSFGSDFAKGLM